MRGGHNIRGGLDALCPPPRSTTVTEEYRVPDGMVGLSEWGGVLEGGGGVTWSGMWGGGVGGGKRGGGHISIPPPSMLCAVPAVIGRGGEQINKIQQDSGCKVQISPGKGGTKPAPPP